MARAIYINWKGPQGRETVDSVEMDRACPTARDMQKEANRLCREYARCGMPVYQSSRPCANWES